MSGKLETVDQAVVSKFGILGLFKKNLQISIQLNLKRIFHKDWLFFFFYGCEIYGHNCRAKLELKEFKSLFAAFWISCFSKTFAKIMWGQMSTSLINISNPGDVLLYFFYETYIACSMWPYNKTCTHISKTL